GPTDFVFRHNIPHKDHLEGRVADVVPESTVNCLREQLSYSPPDYTHVVILLQEVRTTVLSLLLPGHVRLRAEVEEILDLDLIQQQADHGALVLQRLSDPEIRTYWTQLTFVLGLMKTDMVNFTVQSLRPHLLQQAFQYEQATFQENLLKQTGSGSMCLLLFILLVSK
uniref:Uncharacterized protein n=1 Tax=Hucho hucho TaxID=62062 RepID=A0A4W5QGP2_9TELE